MQLNLIISFWLLMIQFKYLLLLLLFNRLYIPTEYKGKPIVHDLYTWLKTEPELTFSGIRNISNHYIMKLYL